MAEKQISELEAQVVKLTAQLQQVQMSSSVTTNLPKGVKVQPPQPFVGKADGDSVQNFVNALDNYYDLMNLRGSNQQARYAETLLTDKAHTWFATQSYDLQTLVWNTLKGNLLVQFCPADYVQQARQQLLYTRQNSPDVADYIARFYLAYNRCSNVSEEEAKFLFKENLWSEISVQVLSAQPSTLKDSQSAAQQIGNVLHNAGIFAKSGKRKRHMRPWLDKPFNLSFKKPPVDASQTGGVGDFAPMVLGQAKGGYASQADTYMCYNCGKHGHIVKYCHTANGSRQQG